MQKGQPGSNLVAILWAVGCADEAARSWAANSEAQTGGLGSSGPEGDRSVPAGNRALQRSLWQLADWPEVAAALHSKHPVVVEHWPQWPVDLTFGGVIDPLPDGGELALCVAAPVAKQTHQFVRRPARFDRSARCRDPRRHIRTSVHL